MPASGVTTGVVAVDGNVAARFSGVMDTATIKGTTFTLKKQGSTTSVAAVVG